MKFHVIVYDGKTVCSGVHPRHFGNGEQLKLLISTVVLSSPV